MSSTSGTACTGCDSRAECELAEGGGEAAQGRASLCCLSSAAVLLGNPDHGFKWEAAFLDLQTKAWEAPLVSGGAQVMRAVASSSVLRADGTSVLDDH